jgi:hypothetical protein
LYEANDDLCAIPHFDEKHDDVAGWIAPVPFNAVVWNMKFSANIDMPSTQWLILTTVRDPAVCSTMSYADIIAPISVGLAAAGGERIIGSRQGAKPLAHDRIRLFPLSVILGMG